MLITLSCQPGVKKTLKWVCGLVFHSESEQLGGIGLKEWGTILEKNIFYFLEF